MSNKATVQRVAANVRAEMARRSVTQSDLALTMGRSQHFVSRRLLGKVPFDIDELDQIASQLGVDLADLIAEASA